MAVEYRCGRCGEAIPLEALVVLQAARAYTPGPASVLAPREPDPAPEFHYHAGDCFEWACEMLRDRERAAISGEPSTMTWRLVDEADTEVYCVTGRSDCFRRVGIRTLGDAALWREQDLAALPGVGPKSLADLKEALANRGMAFADQHPEGVAV